MLLHERQAAIQRFQEHERQILQQRTVHQQSPQTIVEGNTHNMVIDILIKLVIMEILAKPNY